MMMQTDHYVEGGEEAEDDPFGPIVAAAAPPLVLRCKIALLGDSGAGKTSLVKVFQSGEKNFPKQYNMTIGIEFSIKRVPILADATGQPSNVVVEMYIVDCGGFSIPQDLLRPHWENANAVMFVYDVSNPDSFNNLGKWYDEFRQSRSDSGFPGAVVASKADLCERPGAVAPDQGMMFSRERAGLEFFESSAARADVDAPFTHLAERFYSKYKERKEELRKMKPEL